MKAKELKKATSSCTKLKKPIKPIVLNSSPTIKRGMFRRGGCCGKAK
ncbi:hypothetical protein J32TS6_20500 [Virgibacillus pantothenticus]|nr:hypothetical protein J32TS6_20500 [Virgibacillus pantothenticus]